MRILDKGLEAKVRQVLVTAGISLKHLYSRWLFRSFFSTHIAGGLFGGGALTLPGSTTTPATTTATTGLGALGMRVCVCLCLCACACACVRVRVRLWVCALFKDTRAGCLARKKGRKLSGESFYTE